MTRTTVSRLLDLEMKVAAWEPPKRKHQPGSWILFMKEQGDKKVRNPETGNQVKIKSLTKTDKGRKVIEREFEAWAKKNKDRDIRKELDALPHGPKDETEFPEDVGAMLDSRKKKR